MVVDARPRTAVDDRQREIAEIARLVREHLDWEAGLQGAGVPFWEPELGATAGIAPETVAATPIAEAPIAQAPIAEAPIARAPVAAAPVGPTPVAPQEPEPVRISLPLPERITRLRVLADEAATCTRCVLHASRTHSVFARGNVEAEIAFVGEGPGANEDEQGLPFVGPAGQLLDKMIGAMGFDRDDVYVCNVVKCRPPENRTPQPDEAAACDRYLTPQLETVGPKVIVALGRVAAESLGCAEPGRSWRGMWGSWRGIPVMPTYHPAFLLRSPEMKRPVWEDLQKVLGRIGRTPPSRSG